MADHKKPADQQKKRQRFPEKAEGSGGKKSAAAANNKTPSPPVAAPAMAPPSTAVVAVAPPSPVAMVRPIAVVKREREEREVVEGRAGPTVLAAAEAEEGVSLTVKKKWLHCAACPAPLKPPIFMREDGHVVCRACCGGATCFHIPYMDGLVADCEVPCPYTKFGCARSIAYHATADHMAACAHAPCYCLECTFEGSPASLMRHLAEVSGRHRWPVVTIIYETARAFVVPASEYRCLLFAVEDCRVFLLAVGAGRGPSGIRTVTVVCVRGQRNNHPRPLYTGLLCVDGPPVAAGHLRGGSRHTGDVPNCGVPAEVDMKHGSLHAHVNPELLHGESKELHPLNQPTCPAGLLG